jgi:hypothetical protein
MLKYKPYADSEVKFLEVRQEEKGLLCEQPNAETCFVRCDHQTFNNPPPVGSVITVTHEGLWNGGKLKSPQFLRTRSDLRWIQVLQDYYDATRKQRVSSDE